MTEHSGENQQRCPLCAAHGFDSCTVDEMRQERDRLRQALEQIVANPGRSVVSDIAADALDPRCPRCNVRGPHTCLGAPETAGFGSSEQAS